MAPGIVKENTAFIAMARNEDVVMKEVVSLPVNEVIQPRPIRMAQYSEPIISEHESSFIRGPLIHRNVHLSPTLGIIRYDGAWKDRIDGGQSIGLLASKGLTQMTALEIDFAISQCRVKDFSNPYDMTQFGVNANFRLSLLDGSKLNPYVAAGLGWNNYLGLRADSHTLMLHSQLVMGIDYEVTTSIRVGIRGAYSAPLLNRTASTGQPVNLSGQDTSPINSGFFRGMALVGIAL